MGREARLWQEVSRHLELEESVARLEEVLRDAVPGARLLVCRFQEEPPSLLTLAPRQWAHHPTLSARQELTRDQATSLTRAQQEGRAVRLSQSDWTQSDWRKVPWPKPVLDGLAGGAQLLLCPLGGPSGEGGLGLVLFEAGDGETQAALEQLHRVLCVAYDNERRLQEMSRMREALDADRRALLDRLHRDALLDGIVGENGGLRTVMTRVSQVAPTDAPVLLLGETGSGKEVIARAIHARSRRCAGPMVVVNCGALPPELIDSELFGHERGAFTGASQTRKGWFERADGGTLFLDEIGELPLQAQVRLLRVLQDGTLKRLGAQQTSHVDVRIIAATHRQLETMVSAGQFREDLWYRLNVFPIRLPALRERAEDLAALAEHLTARVVRRLGLPPLSVTASDLALQRAHDWPGNVRELSALLERAAILGGGAQLDLRGALGSVVRSPSKLPPALSSPAASDSVSSLDDAVRRHIERALALTGGKIEGVRGAAELLAINPHTLRARMRKLGIDWRRFRARREEGAS